MLTRTLTAFAFTTCLAAGVVHAQAGPPDVDQVVNLLTTTLHLTDEQQRAIAPLIAQRRAKLEALRDANSSGRPRRREARAIVADGDRQINAVLSLEQQREYAALERQLIERLREHHGQPQ